MLALAVPAAIPAVAKAAPAAAAVISAVFTIVRVLIPASLLCPHVGDQAPVSLAGNTVGCIPRRASRCDAGRLILPTLCGIGQHQAGYRGRHAYRCGAARRTQATEG